MKIVASKKRFFGPRERLGKREILKLRLEVEMSASFLQRISCRRDPAANSSIYATRLDAGGYIAK